MSTNLYESHFVGLLWVSVQKLKSLLWICEFQYKRGQASNRTSWVFGMLGLKGDRRRPILKIVRHRSASHLKPLIKKHIWRGSSIISDGWRSYHHLQNEGYNHLTVNHQEYFIDPITGSHTQYCTILYASWYNQSFFVFIAMQIDFRNFATY